MKWGPGRAAGAGPGGVHPVVSQVGAPRPHGHVMGPHATGASVQGCRHAGVAARVATRLLDAVLAVARALAGVHRVQREVLGVPHLLTLAALAGLLHHKRIRSQRPLGLLRFEGVERGKVANVAQMARH